MQDRVLRSPGEFSRSLVQTPNTDPIALETTRPRQNSKPHWLVQSVWLGLGAVVFGAMIVGSELAVTRFRALAAEPINVSQENVLLDFTAKWCGPCQSMSPIISRLERQGFPIRKVDIDQNQALTRQFNVESIPCFVLVVNGHEINRITGATDERELRRLLALLPRQNIDDSLVAKNSKQTGQGAAPNNFPAKSTDDKKSFLRIPPLFSRNQDKDQDVALTPTTPDTFRGQNPLQDTNSDGFARDPMQVSVRIRVKDGSRVHYGSGTLIDSQPGRSVLLTCGHIFRDLGKDASVEVDVFSNGASKPQTVIGQILRFDLKSDLGLVSLPTKGQLPVIRLSSPLTPPAVRDRVVSIGCGGGERPSREDHQITAINRYIAPDNIECDGTPQQGRSGGGLFLNSELIGVCIGADHKDKRGIYTSMKPVAQLLEKTQLGYLIPSNQSQSSESSLADHPSGTNEATLGNAVAFNDEAPRKADEDLAGLLATAAAARESNVQPASMGDYVGAEIVCIVRPKTPGATTRVVIVNQASSRFVNDLLHEPGSAGRNEATAAAQPAANKNLAGKTPTNKSLTPSVRMAKQAPSFNDRQFDDLDGPIETSYETQRSRRVRD